MAGPTVRRSRSASSSPVTETDLQHHSQELGKMGSIFGSRENAPVYFAGILALIALLGAISVGVLAAPFPEKGDLVKALVALTVSALSFIGGASGRGR